ncbi:Multidrug resistance protein MdtA [Parvicella tangerina]|uniref:Multidrug resistance protein MdtA n=2 Tax=Parvicella tangerina TaxID=2829795 RepID=A0A916NRY0_9FLAO|nr:Multidrug resistance protein MdtA [Parvicella tangerina]
MKQMSKYRKYALIVLVLGGIVSGCSSEEEVENTNEPATTEGEIILNEEQISNGDIQYAEFSQQAFTTTISVNGRVELMPDHSASVSSFFEGNVVKVFVEPGEKVEKGQQLFTIKNPSFIKTQEEYLITSIEKENLQIEYDRQKGLADEQITSLKAFQKAEKELLLTKAKLAALETELNLMNVRPDKLHAGNLTSEIAVFAPISGNVTAMNIEIGTHVSPSVTALKISGNQGKYLVFEIFEKDIDAMSGVQTIDFKRPNDVMSHKAAIVNVLPYIDGAKKSLRVYARAVNDSTQLIAGGYVSGEVKSATTLRWALPATAIIKDEGGFFAWVVNEANEGEVKLKKMVIEPGETVKGFTEVINFDQLPPNSKVVSKGGFNL